MDAANKKSLANQHDFETTVEGLEMLLKSSEIEKYMYIKECEEAKTRVSELELRIREMVGELTGSKSTQGELIRVEKELVEAMSCKLEALEQMEVMKAQVKDIEFLEGELTRLKMELKLRDESELTRLETIRSELDEIRDRENKAQVELELLKVMLHEQRLKTAVVKPAEFKTKDEKSTDCVAPQRMDNKTQEVGKENKRLTSEQEEIQIQNSTSNLMITISLEEYKTLTRKSLEAEVNLQMDPKSVEEIENLKKDLEIAMMRMSDYNTRVEHATILAEVAEREKADLEEQITERKGKKQRRRAALAALREESTPGHSIEYEDNPKTSMPLGNFFKKDL